MLELTAGFQSLPPEYQRVLLLAQEQHQISLVPLETLVGGWSGAMVFLVSVTHLESQYVEHLILKLDRKSKTARSDELSRHALARSQSPAEFGRDHLATLAFERVEADGAIAIFYSIAGQSLQAFRPLSSYSQQHQLETIFTATNHFILEEWNANASFAASPPQELLKKWLGFRLDAGAPIESFIRQSCRADPERPGFLIQGGVFPNPLRYARHQDAWGNPRSIDAVFGLQHGDLNTNNILVKFLEDEKTLAGCYLIDFALFKTDMPLLYDLRYLEMSYLILGLSQVSFVRVIDQILQLAEGSSLDLSRALVETAGLSAVLSIARAAFERWIRNDHPSLEDDLWGQYWLAGVAAGLSYCHKAGQAEEPRLAGLIYAAANLKCYFDSFSIPLPTEVQHLYSKGQWRTNSQGRPSAQKPQHNLPTQPTPFIGRSAQIAALKDLIQNPDIHLVTLLGPGGSGKTRLSLQVAQDMLNHFSNGVYFVPLADDRDSNQFISRVAQQLDVKEGGRPLLDNIKDYLQDKQLLLVLDNFEQLVSAAPIVAELLASAPQLKIIASSRIALQLQGEHEYPVPPLEFPLKDLSIEELAGYESVRLFVERAHAVQPGFSLTNDNASPVTEICRRLDGLPLALELAAARIKLLPPQAILSRLDDSLKLLTGGARDVPARQQTLRNTLEWSHGLLNDKEKKLYARLGVFVGGFSLEAAEVICNTDGKLDILEGLTSLVNNSLVRKVNIIDGEPRFGMLETIRAYAIECLTKSGEMETLQQAHAQYFGEIVINRAGQELYNANAPYWLGWLERELDNVRATLSWSQSKPALAEFAAGMVMSLAWFWYRRGYFSEGRMWSGQLLTDPELRISGSPRALALMANGLMAIWQGEQDLALAQFKESQTIWHELNNDQYKALVTLAKGIALINKGNDHEAKPLLQESQVLFKEQGQRFFYVLSLVHLGNVELGLGNTEPARALHEKAQVEARTLNDHWLLSFALNNLGEVARVQGQYDMARKYYEEADALLSDTVDNGDKARFVHNLGYIAQHEEEFELAEAQFRKSLKMFRQLGNRRGMAECMAGLAGLKARQGNVEWGAIMLSAAEAVLKETGGAWWPADRVEVEANQTILRTVLSEAALVATQKKGRAMSLEQALEFASEQP